MSHTDVLHQSKVADLEGGGGVEDHEWWQIINICIAITDEGSRRLPNRCITVTFLASVNEVIS